MPGYVPSSDFFFFLVLSGAISVAHVTIYWVFFDWVLFDMRRQYFGQLLVAE